MVILISQNKITDFFMIVDLGMFALIAVSTMILARPQMSASN